MRPSYPRKPSDGIPNTGSILYLHLYAAETLGGRKGKGCAFHICPNILVFGCATRACATSGTYLGTEYDVRFQDPNATLMHVPFTYRYNTYILDQQSAWHGQYPYIYMSTPLYLAQLHKLQLPIMFQNIRFLEFPCRSNYTRFAELLMHNSTWKGKGHLDCTAGAKGRSL